MTVENSTYIYLSNGFYFGFMSNGFLYSRNGICLGWLEGKFVWDLEGKFRGTIVDINGNKYILKQRFGLSPISRPARGPVAPITPVAPAPNIKPANLPVEVVDAFTS